MRTIDVALLADLNDCWMGLNVGWTFVRTNINQCSYHQNILSLNLKTDPLHNSMTRFEAGTHTLPLR